MGSGAQRKRARQKERRQARQEEVHRIVKARRRRRFGVLIFALALIAAGALIVLFAFDGGDGEEETAPTSSPPTDTITVPVEESVACGAELPETAGSTKQTYGEPADQGLDPQGTYVLVLDTSCGTVEIELAVESSPEVANSIAFLASEGFYDGTFFHRIAPDFVAQGGDPQGDGTGGAGYDVVQPPPEDLRYEEGVVAMAKGGNDPPGTAGSQFFIVSGAQGDNLTPIYALLGRVIEGMDVVDEIMATGTADMSPPSAYTYIERATVEER